MKPLELIPELHRATHRVAIAIAAGGLALSQGEAHLLAHLAEAGPSPVGALQSAFGHKRSTLTSYLDRLEERRLVKREPNPDDRRSLVVSLTAAGARSAAAAHKLLSTVEGRALAATAPRDRAAFLRVLAALGAEEEEPS